SPFGPVDAWRDTVDLNLTSAFIVTRCIGPRLTRGAAICNTASIAGVMPGRLYAYGAAKAALIHWTKSLALSLAPEGIRSNAGAPPMAEGAGGVGAAEGVGGAGGVGAAEGVGGAGGLWQSTACDLADRVRRGELAAAALLEHYIARLEAAQDDLNAFVFLDLD